MAVVDRNGYVRIVAATIGSHGKARYGPSRTGWYRQSWIVWYRLGPFCEGMAVMVRLG